MAGQALLVGTYPRRIEASLERVWENVLDWEHLPWQHASTFGAIECIDAGDWGWRANLRPRTPANGESSLIELRVEVERNRYSVRTLDGPGSGNEIWTRLRPIDDRHTDIEVDFHVAGIESHQSEAVFSAFKTVYTRLWDEDEEMMQRRTKLLGRTRKQADMPPDAAHSLDLGSLDEIRAALPIIVSWRDQRFRIVEDAGEFLAHAVDCPHSLGPLDEAKIEGGRIRCPWHGYQFDLRTRRCLDNPHLRLASPPAVILDQNRNRLRLEALTIDRDSEF